MADEYWYDDLGYGVAIYCGSRDVAFMQGDEYHEFIREMDELAENVAEERFGELEQYFLAQYDC